MTGRLIDELVEAKGLYELDGYGDDELVISIDGECAERHDGMWEMDRFDEEGKYALVRIDR